ncbi:MAG: DNA replication/repair protein RecF [Armatimonadota bacterium]|nr:DNA replication/repair protein RecF [Armatimonadota bacterium]
MHIREIQLNNFRNYASQRIEPGPAINIFVGPNAQGKSNLLEAVYLLATTKSHRTNRDTDLIRVGEDTARAYADVVREEQNDIKIEVILSRLEKKIVRLNKVRHSKIADAIGQLNAVIFSAEDLEMIKGDPSERRRFLNLEVSQLRGEYVYALGGYKRALEQRNALLKTLKAHGHGAETLSIWDEQLTGFGSIMLKARFDFITHLAEIASRIHSQLTGGVEELEIQYEPSVSVNETDTVEEVADRFKNDLLECRQQELARGITVRGPHRDDISFRINGMDARYFGSQGQQRTTALAVKLAEIQLAEDMVGEPPVVLLDDVMAELDERRRSHVFDLTFGKCQTFATATGLDEFSNEIISDSAVFNVSSGEVARA